MNAWFIALAGSVFLIVYSYALYPLMLFVWSRSRPRTPAVAVHAARADAPFVSLIVAAYNEEKTIEEKICNVQALDYPPEKLELLIGSDGSTDATDAICARYPWVRFFRVEPRQGKANVLNTLVPHARGEILVMSDANSLFDRGAVRALVRHFDDAAIGAVCGRLVLRSQASRMEDTESSYWNYETTIKDLESRIHSTIGANGGIYAIRRELFEPIPKDTIIDDFLISMNVLRQGRRMVFEREAVAFEEVSTSFRDEFWRKVRIGAGNLQFLVRNLRLLLRAPGFVVFAYLSHKVVRWLIPLMLIAIWVCCLALSDLVLFRALFWAYNATLALAWVGLAGWSQNRIVRGLAYLFSINLALLLGYWRYLLRTQRVTWRKAAR